MSRSVKLVVLCVACSIVGVGLFWLTSQAPVVPSDTDTDAPAALDTDTDAPVAAVPVLADTDTDTDK